MFTGIRTGKYDQIVRWWSSNLFKGLLQSHTLLLALKLILALTAPPVLAAFWIVLFPSYILPTTHQYHLYSYHLSLDVTPANHLLSWCGTSTICNLLTPATRQHPQLVSTPRAACLILPPCNVSIRPPFADLGMLPVTCWPLEVRPLLVPPYPLCNRLFLPV